MVYYTVVSHFESPCYQDKRLSWGSIENSKCVLCSGHEESHVHLFFARPFASQVWSSLLHRSGIAKQPENLVQERHWIASHRKGKRHELHWISSHRKGKGMIQCASYP